MKIDLANPKDRGCCPSTLTVSDQSGKSYPRFYIECGDALLKSLPDSGRMDIAFDVVGRTSTTTDGKTRCTVTVEVKEIRGVKPAKDTDAMDSAEALDRLAELECASECECKDEEDEKD